MNRQQLFRSVPATLGTLPSITFIFIILTVSIAGCNLSSGQTDDPPEFSDENALMYQMYFDSGDPAQNELQTRRFLGHLHLADIEDIFGDISSLPQDEDCNFVGGPLLDEDMIWYLTATSDLVGVNLVSMSPDGTMSSAFDLDGDRVVDILDIRLADQRRISIVTEDLGLDVFLTWLQGLDPFCNNEIIRELDLPNLGCNESGDGSSGGGGGFGDAGFIDPVDMMCSEYDTGPRASSPFARNPNRSDRDDFFPSNSLGQRIVSSDMRTVYSQSHSESQPGIIRYTQQWDFYDAETGEYLGTRKLMVDVETTTLDGIPEPIAMIESYVDKDGHGVVEITDKWGYVDSRQVVRPQADVGQAGAPKKDPGPEGDDSAIAAFCERRANYQSGVEQAASQDPTSFSVSCDDLVGAPSSGGCTILEWARPDDFLRVLEPPADEAGCDQFDEQRKCEPGSVQDQIRRVRGLVAELRSLDVPDVDMCPGTVCDPAQATENRVYLKGETGLACPVPAEPANLEPSEENCPPGTYYAPVTNRCIAIDVPQGGDSDGGSCNLSVSACGAEGLSFDSNKCKCVPLE